MQYQELFDLWLDRAGEDADLTAELKSVRGKDEEIDAALGEAAEGWM